VSLLCAGQFKVFVHCRVDLRLDLFVILPLHFSPIPDEDAAIDSDDSKDHQEDMTPVAFLLTKSYLCMLCDIHVL